MSNTLSPLRLNGASIRTDKSGLTTVVVPWEVYTIGECETFVPSGADAINLPITARSGEEMEIGTWRLMLTHEGVLNTNRKESSYEYSFDPAMSEDPIMTHPFFAYLQKKYGWEDKTNEFSKYMPKQDANSLTAGSSKSKISILYGTTSWMVVGGTFTRRYTIPSNRAAILRSVFDKVGEILKKPPGYDQSGFPALGGKRNFLKLLPQLENKGNATTVSEKSMLSGPNGWADDIYNFSQLALKG